MNISEINTSNIETTALSSVQITHLTGSIMYFSYGSNNSPPHGWLHCDGSPISRTAYSDLFNVIGTTYGTGDGSTTFYVPDTRGLFVRCCALGADWINSDWPNQPPGGVQGYALKRMEGWSDRYQCDYSRVGWWDGLQGTFQNSRYGGRTDGGGGSDTCGYTDFYASRQSLVGSEFRPKNHCVYACIKY